MVHNEKDSKAIAKEMMRLENLQKRKTIPEEEFVTEMKDPDNILEIEDLRTCFYTDGSLLHHSGGEHRLRERGSKAGKHQLYG